jgi:succinate dehydrogenase/fumarate reductase-like Fe-S protein
MGALSLTGDWRRAAVEPGVPGAVHALDCYCDRCPFGKTLATCSRECATHIGDVMELEAKRKITRFIPRPPDSADGTWRMKQEDVDRVMEFRTCIECFLCQDVCHVLREHRKFDEFIGPRLLVHSAALEMHPLDVADRRDDLRRLQGIGYCNITKCCTKVCPENITITDNAIIPLKERVADDAYDPLRFVVHAFFRRARGKR